MIKKEELRIGNIVDKKFAPDGTYEWSFFRAEEFSELDKYPDNFRPTVLTEEWLARLGIKLQELEDWEDIHPLYTTIIKGGLYHIKYSYDKDGFYVWSGIGSAEEYGRYVDIEYVHQLQNLYFALTGEELKPLI